MGPAEFTIGLLVLVGGGAWLMKAFSGEKPAASASPRRPSSAPFQDDDEDEDVEDVVETEGGLVPLTADGFAFVPRAHDVLLLPLLHPEQEAPDWLDRALDTSAVPFSILDRIYFRGAAGGVQRQIGSPLSGGDLTAARVVRGRDPEGGAWRLETLGRDGDYGFHPFATREGADTALEMLVDRHIVQRPLDEEGHTIPESPEDFEEARLRFERTQAELALEGDDDDHPREGPWVSDRR